MIRIIKYFSLFLVSFLWLIGCSTNISRWLVQNNWVKDDYRYGDLYRLSNLSKFRVPVEKCKEQTFTNSIHFRQNLLLVGDSFTEPERINGTYFNNISQYQRFFIGDTAYFKLDTSKRNILIIETVERHFRERFAKPYQNIILQEKKNTDTKNSFLDLSIPYNTERHEAILFSSDFFLKIKELKAAINQQIFGRIDEKVKLSKNGEHLLYALDANSTGIHSNFEQISEKELQQLIANLNETYNYYKKSGFSEVYLSIIPNKTTIEGNDLGKYNQLISKIQSNPNLSMPIIDTYLSFSAQKTPLYDVGDTHWNCKGKSIWIDKVNQILRNKP